MLRKAALHKYREKIYQVGAFSYLNINKDSFIGHSFYKDQAADPYSEEWFFGRHQHWARGGRTIPRVDDLYPILDYSQGYENV